MSLNPKAIAELERRGARNIRLLLQDREMAGGGATAIVKLGLSDADPMRSDVENWLRAQDDASESLASERHAQLMSWAKIAGIAAVVGAVAAIAAVIATVWAALR